MQRNLSAICLILASLVALSAQDHYKVHKRGEIVQENYLPDHEFSSRYARARSPFRGASRFGRSAQSGHQARLEVEPRGDRFFMGSRYGKRSLPWAMAEMPDGSKQELVACLYTGVVNLFRCINHSTRTLWSEEQPQTQAEDSSSLPIPVA